MADTTIETDTETVRLVDQLARLKRTTASAVVRQAVMTRAEAAGIAKLRQDKPQEAPETWVDRMIAVLDTLPKRPADDRSIDEIIGYDEHGMTCADTAVHAGTLVLMTRPDQERDGTALHSASLSSCPICKSLRHTLFTPR